MNEAAKNSKNIYSIEYQIKAPVADGLKPLFQQMEELRSEFGLDSWNDDFAVKTPGHRHYEDIALINYSREDALLVLTGSMSEEEYIMRHISLSTDADGNILTDEDGGLDSFSVKDIF